LAETRGIGQAAVCRAKRRRFGCDLVLGLRGETVGWRTCMIGGAARWFAFA
jgi:hypothetical protein